MREQGSGFTRALHEGLWATACSALLMLALGAGSAFGDCCICTTPIGSLCGPVEDVPCDRNDTLAQCPGTAVPGTCVGGENPDGTGYGGRCLPAPTSAPLLTPTSPAFVLAALVAAAAVIFWRRRTEH